MVRLAKNKNMPQMDFSTFFPQVFWLVLLITFYFMFFLRGFFTNTITILKLKSIYFFYCFFILKKTIFLLFTDILLFFKIINFKIAQLFFITKNFYKNFLTLISFFSSIFLTLIQKEQFFQTNFLNSIFNMFNNFINKDVFYMFFCYNTVNYFHENFLYEVDEDDVIVADFKSVEKLKEIFDTLTLEDFRKQFSHPIPETQLFVNLFLSNLASFFYTENLFSELGEEKLVFNFDDSNDILDSEDDFINE